MNGGNYNASCMLALLLVSSSVFYVAQSVLKKCTRMCRQWWTVKLHGCSCSWNHNTWTSWVCVLSWYLAYLQEMQLWNLQCKISFSFLFYSNYKTWLWKWNTLKHEKYVVDTCFFYPCAYEYFLFKPVISVLDNACVCLLQDFCTLLSSSNHNPQPLVPSINGMVNCSGLHMFLKFDLC